MALFTAIEPSLTHIASASEIVDGCFHQGGATANCSEDAVLSQGLTWQRRAEQTKATSREAKALADSRGPSCRWSCVAWRHLAAVLPQAIDPLCRDGHDAPGKGVPRGLEPRTLRLLAARSNQLSYETCVDAWTLLVRQPSEASRSEATWNPSATCSMSRCDGCFADAREQLLMSLEAETWTKCGE